MAGVEPDRSPSETKTPDGNSGPRLPTFIIVGAMRSGTTALNSYLRAHPQVAVPSRKELHFFDSRWDRGLTWYAAQFSDSGDAVAVGEATPNYMFRPEAIDRLRATIPDVRLIAILRNPADRAYSHYWHDRTRGKIEIPFTEVVAQELAEGESASTTYVARGRYLPQIRHVLQRFPRESLHVQAFEDMREDPERIYGEICDFIGVDPEFQPPRLGMPVNEYTEFRSLRLRRWARRLPKRAQDMVGRINRKPSVRYPPMKARVRRRLNTEFRAANAGLSEFVGHALPDWE